MLYYIYISLSIYIYIYICIHIYTYIHIYICAYCTCALNCAEKIIIVLFVRASAASACSARQRSLGGTTSIIREFKDVVFEDVVFDNSRFDIDVTLQNNI